MPRLLLLALLLSASGALSAQTDPNGTLRSGPMLADVTHRGGTIWLQTEAPSNVMLEVLHNGERVWMEGTSTDAADIATFRVFGLEPGATYTYAVRVNGEAVETTYPLTLTTQPLWQWRTDPPDVTVAIGSCYYDNDPGYDRPDRAYAAALTYDRPYGASPAIFEAIREKAPDAMVWLGDNVYLREVDWWSPEGINYRYAHSREEPQLQPLLASAAHYATWDDHDYGPNDSDRSYTLKESALETFKSYWPNPSYGMPGVPGVFTQFQIADAEFFLLDDRWHRAPNEAPMDERVYWGAEQLQWLLDALTVSQAPFKIIANGGQVLNPIEVFETVSNIAPMEREYLLQQIKARGIEGVVLLSGDRHHTELMRMERAGTYPLYEYTSSPLTAGASTYPERPDSPEHTNPIRVDGTLVTGTHNFGTLSFTGPREDRTLTMRAYDAAGSLLWEHAVAQSQLRPPRDD